MNGARRAATLTERLLAFSRRQPLAPKPLNPNRLIAGMSELLHRSLGETIEVEVVASPSLWRVEADPNALENALLNLALNARDAMPQGGRLVIGARSKDIADPGEVQGLAPGQYVCVAVADSGIGMDDRTLKRAAEPFFTTKGVGRGTGLGLSSAYGLAAQSGGIARISSRLGVGTTVELWLPVAEADLVDYVPEEKEFIPHSTRSCLVLLVDDDTLVATATAGMLGQLGHRVLVAPSAALALDLLRLEPGIDLVITDHVMPGMTGLELAKTVREKWPELPIILATGFADLANGQDPGLPRLDKPYRLENLASCIAASLRGTPILAEAEPR
jgi:CheY-like chemotaxis protein